MQKGLGFRQGCWHCKIFRNVVVRSSKMKGKENVQELLNRQEQAADISSPASEFESAGLSTSRKNTSVQRKGPQPVPAGHMPLSPADSLSQKAASESVSEYSDAEDLPRDSIPSEGSDFETGPARCSRQRCDNNLTAGMRRMPSPYPLSSFVRP